MSATLADRIRTATAAKGLSMPALAEASGVHRGTIWRWSRGDQAPQSLAAFGRVADVLDIDADAAGLDAATTAAALRTARTNKGMSLPALADATGVHRGTIWRWERGTQTPSSLAAFGRVADTLGLTPAAVGLV